MILTIFAAWVVVASPAPDFTLDAKVHQMSDSYEKLTAMCFASGWNAAKVDGRNDLSPAGRREADKAIKTIKAACHVP